MAVIEQARSLQDRSGLLFPSPARPGRPLSDNTLSKLLRDLGVAAVPHGFRASFRTWGSERTNTPREILEMALAHAVGDLTERSYRRTALKDKRRKLMNRWARFATSEEAS